MTPICDVARVRTGGPDAHRSSANRRYKFYPIGWLRAAVADVQRRGAGRTMSRLDLGRAGFGERGERR
jgi:hypothetical protein